MNKQTYYIIKNSLLKRIEKLEKQIDYLKVKKFKKINSNEICLVKNIYGYSFINNKYDNKIKKLNSSINKLITIYEINTKLYNNVN
jgi:hypothetical protein